MFLILLLLLSLACQLASAVVIPTLDYPTTEPLSLAQLNYLHRSLEAFGILAFTDIPGFRHARERAMASLGRCHRLGLIPLDVRFDSILPDGTRRSTVAGKGEISDIESCPGLSQDLKVFQNIVTQTSLVFAQALDYPQSETPIPISSFAHIVSAAENHLDHFHMYETGEKESDGTEAMQVHLDKGLFVCFSPSVSSEAGDDGFEIQLADGRFSNLVIPNRRDSALVFMIGDGMKNYGIKRPVPHRLRMRAHSTRLWFGRMFFPPQQHIIMPSSPGLGPIGCASESSLARDLANGCAVSEIYCWQQCVSVAQLTCATAEIACLFSGTQTVWQDSDGQCPECAPACLATNSSSSISVGDVTPSLSDVCDTRLTPTSMFHSGFAALGSNCLIWFFWVLDSDPKYGAASFGACLIGFLVEATSWAQRRQQNKVANACLYSSQVVFVYLSMLLVTSFSVIIFVMVVVGLVAGRLTLNLESGRQISCGCGT